MYTFGGTFSQIVLVTEEISEIVSDHMMRSIMKYDSINRNGGRMRVKLIEKLFENLLLSINFRRSRLSLSMFGQCLWCTLESKLNEQTINV